MVYISSDRVRVIEKAVPPALPGYCIVCKNSTPDRDYIDFDFDIPEFGAVYFCSVCIRVILRLLKWSPPEDIEELQLQLAKQEQKMDEIWKEAKFELYSVLRDSGVFDGYPGFLGSPSLENGETSSGSEQDSSKSSNESRPSDIRKSTIIDL